MNRIVADDRGEEQQVNTQNAVIKSVEDYINMLNPPKDFTPRNTDNVLVQMDRSFESICSALIDIGVSNPKKLTLMEFQSHIDHFERKNKESSKQENG